MKLERRIAELGDLFVEAQAEIAEGSAEIGADLCRILIDEWTDIQGPEGERVLVCRGFLGRALTEARRYQEAEEVLAALLIDRERLLGLDHESVLVTRGNLARVTALSGRPQEAILQAERLLADRLRILGPDHPSVFDSMGHIAHFNYLMGDFATAADLYQEVLDERIRVLSPNHPDIHQTRYNLIASRAKSGRPSDIDGLQELALSLQSEMGLDHFSTLNAFALLTEALIRIGNFTDALEVGLVVREGRSRSLGDRDAKTLSARLLVANAYCGLGNWPQAIAEAVTVIKLNTEFDRENESTGLPSVVKILDAWLEAQTTEPMNLSQSEIDGLLSLSHWLEDKSTGVELSLEYQALAQTIQVVLTSTLS
jgi:tetratricopeptide (TPR) repeat protein